MHGYGLVSFRLRFRSLSEKVLRGSLCKLRDTEHHRVCTEKFIFPRVSFNEVKTVEFQEAEIVSTVFLSKPLKRLHLLGWRSITSLKRGVNERLGHWLFRCSLSSELQD